MFGRNRSIFVLINLDFFITVDKTIRIFIQSFFLQLKQYISIYNKKINKSITFLAPDLFIVINIYIYI